MKRIVVICMIVSLLTSTVNVDAIKTKTVDILFTHDMHAHLDGYSITKNGKVQQVGGFARIKTYIDQKKQTNPNTFVFDGGDYSMGTLYQTLYESEAPELYMLGKLGYDATTLGNHEFDYGAESLSKMINRANQYDVSLPQMVICNIDWKNSTNKYSQTLKKCFDQNNIKDYTVIKKGNIKIAVFGVFGKDSAKCSPSCELTFSDPIEAAKKTVKTIKEKEDVDMIVCLSHSGTNEDSSKSEDQQLAREVGDIDIIVSGHTHTELKKPIVEGNTYVVSSGKYGLNVGDMTLQQTSNKRWKMKQYHLETMNQSIIENQEVLNDLKTYTEKINSLYMNKFGYSKDDVIAYNPYEFESVDDHYFVKSEHRLGNLLSDSYMYTLNQMGIYPDVAVVPAGVIRETLNKGSITASDAFNTLCLGKGQDGLYGYGLVGVYLTGEELKLICEIDTSISDYMNNARLYMSGLTYTYNPDSLILNKVIKASLNGKKINDDQLYYVVADMYSAMMLASVNDMSYGLLSLKPKDKEGNPIKDFNKFLIHKDGVEVKSWEAVANYLQSFPKNQTGVPVIDQKYNKKENRKVSKPSLNIFDHLNKYAFMIFGVVFIGILLIVLLIYGIYRLIKKLRRS